MNVTVHDPRARLRKPARQHVGLLALGILSLVAAGGVRSPVIEATYTITGDPTPNIRQHELWTTDVTIDSASTAQIAAGQIR